MSSVSSVGSDPSLFTLLQSLNSSTTGNTTTSTNSAQTSATTDDTSSTATHKHHGGHHKGGGGSSGAGALSSQLETSITSALQSAPPGSDPNQVIQQAIQDQLTGKTNPDGTPLTTNTSVSDPAQTATTGGAADPQTAFSQLLQSYGVDPKSFQNDLKSAVQTSQQSGTQVNFSTLFQNFPPGSAVDTVA